MSHIIVPTLFYVIFSGSGAHTEELLTFIQSTALDICYMIATRILKIDFELAEIIEVKVGACNTKNNFFDSV